MRIVSWNVNGLRACARKGFAQFLNASRSDIVCLQEVRAFEHQLDPQIRKPNGWFSAFAPAQRPGYSGVGIYSRTEPERVETSLGIERFDVEGRYIEARFGRLSVLSIYFPKGSGRDRNNSRVPYKLEFYAAVFDAISRARRRGPVFVLGDYNTAVEAIDLARPASNKTSSGFLPQERQVMRDWFKAGWVDTFRQVHGDAEGHYTWWAQWGSARSNNVGWRIDYALASPTAAKRIRDAFIWPQITGSDHCPIGVDVDL
ncbi:MAG: exodeoxyribonuclease III [Proteobacteria bacterium]|nr:exodeoxyribonuclease III [Pseudomonadota bacterium]